MAVPSPPDMVQSVHSNMVIKKEPGVEECPLLTSEDALVKREPVVNLLSPVSGVQPLVWSEDHRLAACTTGSVSLLELLCDVNNSKPDLTLQRTSIAVPTEAHRFQVDLHRPFELTEMRVGLVTVARETDRQSAALFINYEVIMYAYVVN